MNLQIGCPRCNCNGAKIFNPWVYSRVIELTFVTCIGLIFKGTYFDKTSIVPNFLLGIFSLLLVSIKFNGGGGDGDWIFAFVMVTMQFSLH